MAIDLENWVSPGDGSAPVKIVKCPYCGGRPSVQWGNVSHLFYVFCEKCGATGPSRNKCLDAVVDWNRGEWVDPKEEIRGIIDASRAASACYAWMSFGQSHKAEDAEPSYKQDPPKKTWQIQSDSWLAPRYLVRDLLILILAIPVNILLGRNAINIAFAFVATANLDLMARHFLELLRWRRNRRQRVPISGIHFRATNA